MRDAAAVGSDKHGDVVIIGGGLAGLRAAVALHEAGRAVRVLEARDRLGGRILSVDEGGARFDLGPAWYWPGQPRMAALVQALGLTAFEQFAEGGMVFEDAQRPVQRGQGHAAMQGSFRLPGGMGALVEGLAARLPSGCVSLSASVTGLTRTTQGVVAQTRDGRRFGAAHGVLALPPRLAGALHFTPALEAETHRALEAIPTWMAGQAKAVAVYDVPFWREAGLSGDAMSRRGPMVEIHDASPAKGGPYALFGFLGVPPQGRQDEAALRGAVLAQFGRLFGVAVKTPRRLWIKDWAFETATATARDHQPLYAHPRYGLPGGRDAFWEGRLILSGTETASQFGGYLEGALEAAERSVQRVARATVARA